MEREGFNSFRGKTFLFQICSFSSLIMRCKRTKKLLLHFGSLGVNTNCLETANDAFEGIKDFKMCNVRMCNFKFHDICLNKRNEKKNLL